MNIPITPIKNCLTLGFTLLILGGLGACGSDHGRRGQSNSFTFTVDANTGGNGSITPTTANISDGQTGVFIITPDAGFMIDSVVGCGGTLSGRIYTTDSIAGDCTITASFIEIDAIPDAFSFTALEVYDVNTPVASNGVTVSGINVAVAISVSGGEYAIDDGAFVSGAGTVNAGQTVKVRLISSSTYDSETTATLMVGGFAADFSVATVLDDTPPSATVTFPPVRSLTDSDRITVTGTASDSQSGVVSVSVNGVEAGSVDNFATWSAEVDLSPGANTLTVEVSDAVQNTNASADTFEIESSALLTSSRSVVFDETNNRVLLTDSSLQSLVAVDLNPGPGFGARAIVSNSFTPNDINSFSSPQGIALDPINNRALITDIWLDALLAVDLSPGPNFGARSIISDDATPNDSNGFSSPFKVVLDDSGDRALVVDSSLKAVVAVDLDTGARSIVSDSSTPDNNNPFDQPHALALDSANNRVLVVDPGARAIFAVDLSSGTRTIVSDNNNPVGESFITPLDIVLDSANNRALVTDIGRYKIIAVDLSPGANFGARSLISSNSEPDIAPHFSSPGGIALDSANNRVFVVNDIIDSLQTVDLTPGPALGTRTAISEVSLPDSANPLITVFNIAIDETNKRALLVSAWSNEMMEVNLDQNSADFGRRNVISGRDTPNSDNLFDFPWDLDIDTENNRALVLDDDLNALLAVNLTPGPSLGERSIVSDGSMGVAFDFARAFAVDSTNNRALVVDSNLAAVIEIDLSSGLRTILSDANTPNNDNALVAPRNIVLDKENNRALVIDMIDSTSNRLMAVDLNTGANYGARTILSSFTLPNGSPSFTRPEGLFLDSANNRALVVDWSLDALIAIDLTPGPSLGTRTVLSDNATPNGYVPFVDPVAVTVDRANNLILVMDRVLGAIIAVDPGSGQRVVVSK